MSDVVRIAHVSDLHLTADDEAKRSEPKLWGRLKGMNANLRALLGAVQATKPAALIVTGDITDRGDLRAWEIFWRAVADAGLAERTLIVPGNHDVAVLGVRMRPKSEDLARARAGLRQGNQPTAFPWARRITDDCAVFGLDSTNGGNTTGVTNAVGSLGVDQLIKLGKHLDEHRACPIKIVVLHHSPNIPQTETARRRGEKPLAYWERTGMQLAERDRIALRVLARVFGVNAILHGHTHDSPDRRVNSVRMIGCPASTEPVGGELLYRAYDLFPQTRRLAASLRGVVVPFAYSARLGSSPLVPA